MIEICDYNENRKLKSISLLVEGEKNEKNYNWYFGLCVFDSWVCLYESD